jgi:hypothetical protein
MNVYEKLMTEALRDFERYDNSPVLTEALHARLPNSEDETDYAAWEQGLKKVLVNNDALFRESMGLS